VLHGAGEFGDLTRKIVSELSALRPS
jgi:hypothetical protein